jgi:phosphoesterase RecJ-like protein
MFSKLTELIQSYDVIIIHRHKNPDGDAIGAQLGLKHLIMDTYPNKTVYAVGDENHLKSFGEMDTISDDVFEGALSIVVDVAVSYLVSDKRYTLSDHVLVIDHHLNDSDVADTFIQDSSVISAAMLIARYAKENNCFISSVTATLLLLGIITDSGRFKYPAVNEETFLITAYLINKGADLQSIYKRIYTEQLEYKKLKGYFINHFKHYNDQILYMENDLTVKDLFGVSTFMVSRGMVNQMANIEGIEIWANFTEDENHKIICELRSAEVPIVDVAKQFGGGGHALACGCTLDSFDQTSKVLEALNQTLKEYYETYQ